MEKVMKYNREYIVHYKVEPKFDGEFEVIKREFASLQNGWFMSTDDAITDYNKYYEIAQRKYEILLDLFEKIKSENDIHFSFDYYYSGDTYGIDEECMYIEIIVNDYRFKFVI